MDVIELVQLYEQVDLTPVDPQEVMQAAAKIKPYMAKIDQENQLVLYALFKQFQEGKSLNLLQEHCSPILLCFSLLFWF